MLDPAGSPDQKILDPRKMHNPAQNIRAKCIIIQHEKHHFPRKIYRPEADILRRKRETMRAFYTGRDGLIADLCQYLYRETTRLQIIDTRTHQTVLRKEYKTWTGAKIALSKRGRWTNEITGQIIGK